MNGTSGFQEVRSSTSRLQSYRFLDEQRHQFVTRSWQLLLLTQSGSVRDTTGKAGALQDGNRNGNTAGLTRAESSPRSRETGRLSERTEIDPSPSSTSAKWKHQDRLSSANTENQERGTVEAPFLLRSMLLPTSKRSLMYLSSHRIVLLCLSIPLFFNGCHPMLGYRPELSTIAPETIDACKAVLPKTECENYYRIVTWGEKLAQAYRTKALVNEWSVYAAGALGIIGGAVVGTLTATDSGNTDAAKIIPPVTGAFVALLAFNQSDDKADAYGEAIVAIEESKAAAQRYVMGNKQTKEAFESGSSILYDSIQQEIINLDIRMVAIRKKMAASIPTTTELVPQSFTTAMAGKPLDLIIHTKNLDPDQASIRVITVPETDATVTDVKTYRVAITLKNFVCRDYLIMLSVGKKLALPARNLQCKK